MIGLIGKKVGMTRIFGQVGESIPVTAIIAGPCRVVQIKTSEKEGYQAIQLGAFDRRKKLVRKPQLGHFSKAGVEPKAKLAEFRVGNVGPYRLGQELRVDIFQEGDRVKVTGTSKGKGFAGVVKRWGFSGGPKTHGQSDRHRAPGSIGGASWPARVWKGMKMAGRMGSERVTIPNVKVVKVDLEQNVLLLKGAVPGARNGYLLIQRTTELTPVPISSEEEEKKAKSEGKVEEKIQKVSAPKVTAPEAPSSSEEEVPQKEEAQQEVLSEETADKTEPKKEIAEKSQQPPTPEQVSPEIDSSSSGETPAENSAAQKEEAAEKRTTTPEEESTGEKKG
jgi:large subunit ribosomal protein L3